MDQHHSSAGGDSPALWDWNLASNRIHFSPRWISLVGCEDHEVGNAPEEWLERVHPDDLASVLRELDAARADGAGELDFEHRLRHSDGGYRWMSCRGTTVRNDSGQVIRLTGSHSDVTVATVTDPLTRLPNGLLLLERLTRSIERTHRYQGFHFAVLLLDLGRSETKGASGSMTGDAVLIASARRLETCLRVADDTPSLRHNDLVARLQGDQFAILLDGLKDVGHAKVVADRVLAELLLPFTVGGQEVRLPVSLGIAVSATGYMQAADVLRDAETALHRARVLGASHCEVFDTAILQSEQAELQLESELEAALEQRQFQLHYQPIVSIASNQIVGFEALVRWQHPVLGMIAPLDFIPLAERTGFIVPLGNWILREACVQLRTWQDSVPRSTDIWMSVNLSGVQLRDPQLVEWIGEALRSSGLQARSLVLELTEGIAMENPAAVKTLLMQIRAMGIRISIDDFGTGYSSLAYLRQFPIDALKIDRSFVRGMETHKDVAEIVGSLTAMAQQLGLHVIAEGIENEDQMALLRSLRCESAQGYLFAKPLDVNKATDLLTTGLPPKAQSTPHQEPALSLQSESSAQVPKVARKLSSTEKWSSVAAAVAVVMCGGLIARSITGVPPAVQSPAPSLENPQSELPVQSSPIAAVPVEPPVVDPFPVRAPDVTVITKVPTAAKPTATMKRKQDLAAKLPAQPPVVVMSAPTAPPVIRETDVAAPKTAQPAVLGASADVVHLHRLGSCQGRLVVSRDGVTFVPDEKTGKDNFTFMYSEFLHTQEDGALTIKSNTRTYRFKAVAENGIDGNGPELDRVVDSIARFRERFGAPL